MTYEEVEGAYPFFVADEGGIAYETEVTGSQSTASGHSVDVSHPVQRDCDPVQICHILHYAQIVVAEANWNHKEADDHPPSAAMRLLEAHLDAIEG